MDFLTGPLQTISAFVVFVVGCFAVFLLAVICFALAACVYKGGCLAWAYRAIPIALDQSFVSQSAAEKTSGSRIGRRRSLSGDISLVRTVNR